MEPCIECGELITEETLPDLIPRERTGQLGLPLIRYSPMWVHVWTGHQRCDRRHTVATPRSEAGQAIR